MLNSVKRRSTVFYWGLCFSSFQAGTIKCTAPACPAPNCLETYTPVGECCPRCRVHNACDRVSLAVEGPTTMRRCDNQGALYLHNQWWFLEDDQCTECICRVSVDMLSWWQTDSPGPNLVALLTVSTESVITEAGNSVRTASILHITKDFYPYKATAEIRRLHISGESWS